MDNFKESPLMYAIALGVVVFVILQSLFFIIKSLAMKFKNQANERRDLGGFYYNIVLDNISCEYANLITTVDGLEKDNARNS